MNIQQLRHSLKVKWLLYYRQNRPWLTKLRIWGTYEGQRRPSSSFILATLANLEPQLVQMLPFIVALSNNPDQIVVALGLNFNPEEELKSLIEPAPVVETNANGNGSLASPAPAVIKTSANGKGSAVHPAVKTNANGNGSLASPAIATIPNGNGSSGQIFTNKSEVRLSPISQASNLPSWVDESCKGVGWHRKQ